ncbi:DNA/RNA non-specific endonuclease, partial [Lysinibacillus sp. 54212]|uniref:DNA/RNA non-specific endonuclease n=1 Tax=Lysinibacillus sp. 54212 TaxID=3119829 RepID=UPI002FC71A67
GFLIGIGTAIFNPIDTFNQMWGAVEAAWERDVINGDARSRAAFFSYAIVSAVGLKGVDKLGKLGKAASNIPYNAMKTGNLKDLVKNNVLGYMQQKGKQLEDLWNSNFSKEAITKTFQAVKNSAIVTKARNVLDPDNIKAVMAKTYEDVIKAPASKTWSWMKDHVFNVKVLDGFQTGLDVVGVFPGFGEIADGINGLIYTARGDELNAALSYSAMIPIVGNASTAGKWINKGADAVGDVSDAAGKTKKTVNDDVTGKGSSIGSKIEVPYGTHIIKNGNKKVLEPNIKYKTEEGYTYETNEFGRIESVEADLQLGKGTRNQYAQSNVGEKDRIKGKYPERDDGGHLIGSQFKGSGDIDNLVPMNSQINEAGGKWHQMEQEWASALAREGGSAKVKIKPQFTGDSARPDSFIVEYSIDGGRKKKVTIQNQIGG